MQELRLDRTKLISLSELQKPLSRLYRLGFVYVSHAAISPHGDCQVLFTHEKWGDVYTKNNLAQFDPCVRYLYNTEKTMIPWRIMARDWRSVDVMEERNKSCGIKDGLSIYCRDKSGAKFLIGLGSESQQKVDDFLLSPPLGELKESLEELFKAHQIMIKRSCW